MELKKVFESAEDGKLTYEQFKQICDNEKAKFVDLSEGKYISVSKHNDELKAKTDEIETLNGTISTRDTDLATLKQQLEDAGVDAGKLKEATDSLAALQGKYDNDMKAYKNQLKKQAYEFAVKEYAGTQKFTSSAAKQFFIQSMINKDLKMEGDKILGADDFVTAYKVDNSDSFVTEPETPPAGAEGAGDDQIPHFVHPTQPQGDKGGDPTGGFHFNFTGVRPMPEK